MTAAGLLILAALAPVVSRRLSGDVCAPSAIAASLWGGTMGLFALRLLPYPPLQPLTVGLLAATVAILVAASAAAAWWWTRGQARTPAPHPLPGAAWWVGGYAAIAIAGTIWFVAAVLTTLPNAFSDAVALRYALFTYQIPSTFLFAQLFAIATPLVTLALLLSGTRLPWPLIALGAICAAGTFVSTDRTQVFLLVLTAAFMAAFRVGPLLSATRTFVVAVVAVALLLGSFLAVETWVRKSPAQLGLALQLPGAPAPEASGPMAALARAGQRLAGVYLYATGSYAALDRLIAAPPPRTHGAHIAFPLVRPLERLGILSGATPSPIPPYVEICPASTPDLPARTFNAYTFLYYPLVDFGIAGAILYALAIAAVAGVAYGWLRADRTDPLRLLVAGLVTTAFALTIFVNKFNNTAWWYVLGVSAGPWLATAILRPWARPGSRRR